MGQAAPSAMKCHSAGLADDDWRRGSRRRARWRKILRAAMHGACRFLPASIYKQMATTSSTLTARREWRRVRWASDLCFNENAATARYQKCLTRTVRVAVDESDLDQLKHYWSADGESGTRKPHASQTGRGGAGLPGCPSIMVYQLREVLSRGQDAGRHRSTCGANLSSAIRGR